MRKILCAAAAATALFASVSAARADEIAIDAETRALDPITYRNLTLLPIATSAPGDGDDYVILDEAMKAGTVKIIETGDGGEVNELVLINRSTKPLFLMSGEVVIGGKQDRIIGQNMVVAPKKKVKVPVFCVEHGRWSGRRAEFSTAEALAHNELRKATFQGQGKVWAEVSAKNAQRATTNDTDTYRTIATGAKGTGTVSQYQRHFDAALAKVQQPERLVGFVIAVNGQVVGMDVFSSPKLFRKVRGKLMRSYYVHALDVPEDKAAKPVVAGKVKEFALQADEGEARVVVDSPSATTENTTNAHVVSSKVRAKPAPAKPGEPAKDAPKAVFQSTFAQ